MQKRPYPIQGSLDAFALTGIAAGLFAALPQYAGNFAFGMAGASLALAGVRRVRLQLSVADNLPPELGGPQVAQSPVVTIEIVLSLLRTISKRRNCWGKSLSDDVSTSQNPSSG